VKIFLSSLAAEKTCNLLSCSKSTIRLTEIMEFANYNREYENDDFANDKLFESSSSSSSESFSDNSVLIHAAASSIPTNELVFMQLLGNKNRRYSNEELIVHYFHDIIFPSILNENENLLYS
jgi:hypothetical protein